MLVDCGVFRAVCIRFVIASFYTANRLGLQLSTPASQVAGGCCAYTQRTYPNGHALSGRVPTACTGPSQPLLLRQQAALFAGTFGVCYQVLSRFSQARCSLSHTINSTSFSHKLLLPSRLHARLPCCPATLLVSRRATRPLSGTTRSTRCPGTRGYGLHVFLHQFALWIQASNAADPSFDGDDNAHPRHRFSAYR